MEVSGTPFSIPGICCQEILQGAKDSREWRMLHRYLQTQHVIFPVKPWDHGVEAARIYFDCRRKGLTVRSTVDCYIAQQVLDEDGDLLHDDSDFETIHRVRPLREFRR